MPNQKVRFGLTLPNRGAIIGATTVEEMFALTEKAEETGATTIILRLTGYDQQHQFERVTNEVLASLLHE